MTRLKRTDNIKAYVGVADTDAILASTTIANGSFTPVQPDYPRNITIAVTTSTITAGTITVTGTNFVTKLTDTEVLDLSAATTLTGTKMFSVIASVVVASLADNDPADTFIVGEGSTVQLTMGRTTLISAIVGSGASQVGKYQFINNSTGTTTNVAELKQAIAAGVYEFNCSIGIGLRVVISGATPITVVYNP